MINAVGRNQVNYPPAFQQDKTDRSISKVNDTATDVISLANATATTCNTERKILEINSVNNQQTYSVCPEESQVVPEEVLKIYRNNKSNTLHAIISHGNFNDALLLLKYHLYRPDDNGQCCEIAVRQGAPLELIKLCLPDRQYLTKNPLYLDGLQKTAQYHFNPRPEVLSFLFNREGVKGCTERDLYFKNWFNHEMRTFGAKKGEWFEDFKKRKGSPEEIALLISKFPLEVKGFFSIN